MLVNEMNNILRQLQGSFFSYSFFNLSYPVPLQVSLIYCNNKKEPLVCATLG